MTSQDESRNLERLKTELADRLRGVCEHFPESEFADLIDQIARIETKYALRAAKDSRDSPPLP